MRMNPQYEKQLEAGIRRELDALGQLPAPPALANRILAAIEQRSVVPWYRQSWTAWPFALQTASLTVLLLAFGGLCFGAWELTHGGTGQGWQGGWLADAGALWRTLSVLVNTAVTLVGQLGTGIIIAGAALMFVSWVMCIGLGTAYVRLAMRPAVSRI
jgi:hypothetical protein